MTRKAAAALLITMSLGVAVLPMRPATAQFAVFDAANFSQNILTAARALEQINNQIRSLQNETAMLENMARNLQSLNFSSLDTMVSDLQQISTLMNQAQGIAFTVNATQTAFAQSYPQQYAAAVTTDQLVADAHQRWQNSMDAFRQTMVVQAQVAQNVQADTATMSALVSASQDAVGSLQAQQATNQLIALSTKQQLQIQSLMAAQYRATALEDARNAEAEEEARAAFTRFLGTSNAYAPQ
ncbi:MAG TPA: P-type conjugative transfer protein TrbJ [Alphaproteobacteria bacterium]|nr:P-type conjugative transfer protein TrbJ [Alphaproteobacteria bacterium]